MKNRTSFKKGNDNWKLRKSHGSKGNNKGIKFTDEHKRKIGLALKGRTYEELHGKEKALELKEKLRQSKLGKKNPKSSETKRRLFSEGKLKPNNYIDGSSRNRKYMKNDWIDLAKKCYERDNWTCQHCGIKGDILNAHHILSWAGNFEYRFDLNNLITLCKCCHVKIHKSKRSSKTGRFVKNE